MNQNQYDTVLSVAKKAPRLLQGAYGVYNPDGKWGVLDPALGCCPLGALLVGTNVEGAEKDFIYPNPASAVAALLGVKEEEVVQFTYGVDGTLPGAEDGDEFDATSEWYQAGIRMRQELAL